ncbi:MAG TPA: hypothetical protein VNJ04_21345 [Gemmatimonadaceae bacterium]|nr:hypothetical protein [Gemmatimonadaceae bacterium]
MTEDRFEKFLKTAAQGYNAPPPRTPREDMWAEIESVRTAGPRLVYGAGSPASPVARHPFSGRRLWLGAAAAAVLLVATGVGVGRWSADRASMRPTAVTASAGARRAAVPNGPAPTAVEGETPTAGPTDPADLPSSRVAGVPDDLRIASSNAGRSGERAPRVDNPSPRSDGSRRRVNPPAARAPVPQLATAVPGGSVFLGGKPASGPGFVAGTDLPTNQPASAYQLVALRHLSNAEALLTSFRTRSEADAQLDAQLARWARDLLASTRLLLDSPVAADQQRRPLLEDLELVLVQIVQLSPATAAEDRKAIENTLQQENVLTRLRTAIPAGQRGT